IFIGIVVRWQFRKVDPMRALHDVTMLQAQSMAKLVHQARRISETTDNGVVIRSVVEPDIAPGNCRIAGIGREALCAVDVDKALAIRGVDGRGFAEPDVSIKVSRRGKVQPANSAEIGND